MEAFVLTLLLIFAICGFVLFLIFAPSTHATHPSRHSAQTSPYPRPLNIQRFRNPANGYEEEVGTPWIWCLLFGCIYFAVRGI